MSEHIQWMRYALQLALLAEGYTSPNPMVGAVVVRDGQIVGEGYHRHAGMPHAEIEALQAAGNRARGALLYITLEPCNHHGRTPPCTEAIIAAGIAQVIYAIPDPNPAAAGGAHHLCQAGIQVTDGVCADEAAELNRFFLHHIRTQQPYVITKYAMSLDGKIATHSGDSRWITGETARQRGHHLRHTVDAILVGSGTALTDNPRLTTRLQIPNPKHPLRIVLDSEGKVPLESYLFSPTILGQTLVATTEMMPVPHEHRLTQCGVEVLRLPESDSKQVDISALLQTLGQRGIQSLLVEGGSTVLGTFFDKNLVNEVWAFVAPVIIGGNDALSPIGGVGAATLAQAFCLKDKQIEQLEEDLLIRGKVVAKES